MKLPYQWSDDLALSFRLIGWDGQDFDVDGQAQVTYYAFPGSNCCKLSNIFWHNLTINNQQLNAGDAGAWTSKYIYEIEDHVECLLTLLHNWDED
jgi:hypothetical protein